MVAAVSKENRGADQHAQINSGAFFKPMIQAQLSVNNAGDKYEQEADSVADKVMRKDPPTHDHLFFKPSSILLQRKCQHCDDEERKLQRKETSEDADISSSTESYINGLSGGSPLTQDQRNFFEPGMGYDFNSVRIHTGSAAARSASEISALAYTTGNNVVFGEGQYQPETQSGKKLLAHELTHVIQQSGSKAQIQRQTPAPAETASPGASPLVNDNAGFGDLTTRSQSLLERYTSEPQRPPVPTFEAITGSVQGYTSYGRISARIPGAWSRRNVSFTDTARSVTGEAMGRRDADVVPEGSHSGATAQQTYSPRRAIVFSAWNYATWSDVPFVRQIIQAGSPFQRALQSEFGQVANVENPTGGGIRSGIQEQITSLQSQLIPGRIAELMIYFEGHGGAGGICGVDDRSPNACVDFPELQAFAHTARDAGIHVTFILDSCNIGEIVNLAQQEQAGAIENRVNAAGANAAPGATIILSDVRRLLNDIIPIGHKLNGIYNLRGALTAQNRQNLIFPATFEMFSNLTDLQTFLLLEAGNRLTHKDQLLARLTRAYNVVLNTANHAMTYFTLADITAMRAAVAPLIDLVNVQTNELLQQAEQLAPAVAQPPASPTLVPDHDPNQTPEGVIA